MAEAGMPCADSMPIAMDEGQPGLCHAKCDSAQPAGDTHVVQVPSVNVDSGGLRGAAIFMSLPRSFSAQAALLPRATAPPLAIRNCCWRI